MIDKRNDMPEDKKMLYLAYNILGEIERSDLSIIDKLWVIRKLVYQPLHQDYVAKKHNI